MGWIKTMLKANLRGSVAPLALLFTLVSMSFTVAYLKNSFSQSAMEKYRYAEWKALYSAEAGLNDVGIILLPQITGDTLFLQSGVDYGKDENDQPIGLYKDIACSTRFQTNSTRKEYIAYATGVAEYTTPSGTDVSIERRVYSTMTPLGFEDFMYFTDEEEPIGPGNTGVVNFGSGDQLEGKVHTNGRMVMSNFGCPEFDQVAITSDIVDQFGNSAIQNYNNCSDSFEDDDGNSIIDTVATIIFPPDNSTEIARNQATRVFDANDKLFRPGKKDTMIMTEINFVSGGYWATQWWYNIPPVGSPAAEFDFVYDSANGTPAEGGASITVINGGLRSGPNNNFDPETNTYDGGFLLLSVTDISGQNVLDEIMTVVEDGDNILVRNLDNSKSLSFVAGGSATAFGTDAIRVPLLGEFVYFGPDGEGFNNNEPVKFINTSATTGLAENVEWNEYQYYHDHPDNGVDFCEAGRIQHFDFEYWTAGGESCDIFNCPNEIYNSEYVTMSRRFFSGGSSPQVLYVKGGQVLVRGAVDGKYTIVTDDYTEYRRHDDNDKIDRVWGNIWLIDDIIFADSNPTTGAVTQPSFGGTDNVLGLMAGGSVIIANTRPNGARGKEYGEDILINAAIMAMNGGFISHYWQNSLSGYHDWNDGLSYGIIADGRGGHRNHYLSDEENGAYTGTDDSRGTVNLWGSIVQFKRGYMNRNYPGPYNVSPGVGYLKNYNYDYNLRIQPPPYFPDLQSSDNAVILRMVSYGEANPN
jgi:hypothetical protein